MKQSPSKRRFKPSEQITRTSLQETQVKSVDFVCVSKIVRLKIVRNVLLQKIENRPQRLTRKDLQLRLISLAKRYVCSARRTKTGVSRALLLPEIASEFNFDLESHLVLNSTRLQERALLTSLIGARPICLF